MAEAADSEGDVGELCAEHFVQLHRDEAESDEWDHSVAQCLCWAARILLRQNMDEISGEVGMAETALYEAGEYGHSDMRCRQLRHRLQRSVSKLIFVVFHFFHQTRAFEDLFFPFHLLC